MKDQSEPTSDDPELASDALLCALDLDDLHGDLIRYGNYTKEQAAQEFPVITEGLVLRVMYCSDECPACGERWITHQTAKHEEGCLLSHLPQNREEQDRA